MTENLKRRIWWREIKQHRVGIVSVLVPAVIIALITIEVRVNGTGFSGKTLWDWLQLLAVLAIPVVVALGTVWFTTRQGKVADAENIDNQREAALQGYIDKMSELLLHEGLRKSIDGDEIRKVATLQTLIVLPRLDGRRKGSVLLFLSEAGLIDKSMPIVQLGAAGLHGADLRKCDLSGISGASLYNCFISYANLQGADFTGVHLRGIVFEGGSLYEAKFINTDLRDSTLFFINLSWADFTGADLTNATIIAANLTGANITNEQLDKTKILKDIILPDGTKYSK